MTSVVVMGSCLTNLASVFLVSTYGWRRLSNAAVERSDHFVTNFIERQDDLPPFDELNARIEWKAPIEIRRLRECYRDLIGHFEVPLDQPGLFEVLAGPPVDVVLMDNLNDTHMHLTCSRPLEGRPAYSLPLSMSLLVNEAEFARSHFYTPPLTAVESARNWVRIVQFVRELQPQAQIMFYCAHACTMTGLPDRYRRTADFAAFFPTVAPKNVAVMPPLDLPPDLTRMPDDRDHYDFLVYKAMAAEIFLTHMRRPGVPDAERRDG